jgi:hypothetical protein
VHRGSLHDEQPKKYHKAIVPCFLHYNDAQRRCVWSHHTAMLCFFPGACCSGVAT